MAEITVRNPLALTATPNEATAPRATSLDGVTLGLWWNEKPGGEVFLEHFGERLASRSGVDIHRQYQNFPAGAIAVDNAAKAAHVIVGATGD